MELALDGLHHSAGAQIRTADARHQQDIRVLPDLGSRLFDAGKLLFVIIDRQVEPAQEIVPSTGPVFQLLVGKLDLRKDRVIFFRTDEFCQMFAIVLDTHR